MEYEYNSIWSTANYIFQPTLSGVTVYNNDASSIISEVLTPSGIGDFEKYVYVYLEKPTEVNDFLVYLTIDSSHVLYSHTNSSGTDIHFKDSSDQELDFFLLRWNYNGESDICVRVNLYGTDVIKMCFGNTLGNGFIEETGDEFLFYDKFEGSSLASHWSNNSASDFNVSDGQLHVTTAGVTYSKAWINNQQFTPMSPFIVIMKIVNITYSTGTAGYSHMSVYLDTNKDGFSWYPEGSVDRAVFFNGSYTYEAGTNKGFQKIDTILSVGIKEGSIQLRADRAATFFNDVFPGTTYSGSRDLYFFNQYTGSYDVNYIIIKNYTSDHDFDYIEAIVDDTLHYDHTTTNIPTSVWADSNYLYISTTRSGVYKSDLTTIESSPQMVPCLLYPTITNNNVRYIHGNNDQLCVVTVSGVDDIDLTTGSGIYTLCDSSYKCFQTVSGTFYYTENCRLSDLVDESDLGGTLADWKYYREITLNSSLTEGVHNVLLELECVSYGHMQSSGEDIRFITIDGTVLNYFIDTFTMDQYFKIIISVPILDVDSMYMLYGNISASAAAIQIDWELPVVESSHGLEKSWYDIVAGKLHAVYDNTVNWQEDSTGYSYNIIDMVAPEIYNLNDIYITENTSEHNNDNVIFLATSHGAVVIEERKGDEGNSRIKRYYLR